MRWARAPNTLRACIRAGADIAVLVFARAPQPGRAKTRLIPRLGEWRAARLQARLTERAMQTARAAGVGPLELHVTPSRRHASFQVLGRGMAVRDQRGADLGERMHGAIASALRHYRAVILIGTDCPSLRAEHVRRAARWLRGGCDAVLAPAEDGGYGLIGLRRLSPALFHGVEWGAADVYERTAAKLRAGGFRWRALPAIWDVDRPEDLERLRSLRFSSARPRSARR